MAITASISLKENSYSVANNSSSVTCKVTVHWTYSSNDRNGTTKTLTFNGSKFTTTTNINSSVTSSGSMTLFNKTLTVAHNSDGTKTVSASVKIPTSSSSGTVTASKSLTLTAIPRYPSVSQSVLGRNEYQITMQWASNTVIDYAWYSVNGGSWVAIGNPNSTSGQYTISGLTSYTSYTIKTRLRSKDSQLTAESNPLTTSTYRYPYCSTAPAFNIGDPLTLTIYNPMGRTVSASLILADGTEKSIGTTSGTSISVPNNAEWINALYSSIPDSASGRYTAKIVYGSITDTGNGSTYRATSAAAPSFSGESYEDTNPNTTAITQDNQKVIPTRSTLQFDISGITTKYNASVSGAKVTLNSTDYPMTVSGSSATVSNVPLNSSGQNATITLTDSRGQTYSKTVTLDILDYTAPSVSATAERDSGFYSETDITPTANYTSIGANAVTINLKARKVGTTSYTVDQTIPDGQTSQVILDNEFAWEILLTVTDSFGGTGTYNITVARGLPLMYFDTEMNSVGLNQFPSHIESFEIAGDLYINASKLADFPIEEGTDGIWAYRKWSSGVAECWGNVSGSASFTRTWGGLYICDAFALSFPSGLFISNPSAVMSAQGGNSLIVFNGGTLDATKITVQAGRGASASNYNYFIGIHVKGRWKS